MVSKDANDGMRFPSRGRGGCSVPSSRTERTAPCYSAASDFNLMEEEHLALESFAAAVILANDVLGVSSRGPDPVFLLARRVDSLEAELQRVRGLLSPIPCSGAVGYNEGSHGCAFPDSTATGLRSSLEEELCEAREELSDVLELLLPLAAAQEANL